MEIALAFPSHWALRLNNQGQCRGGLTPGHWSDLDLPFRQDGMVMLLAQRRNRGPVSGSGSYLISQTDPILNPAQNGSRAAQISDGSPHCTGLQWLTCVLYILTDFLSMRESPC